MQATLASQGDRARAAHQGFSWTQGFQNSEALGRRGRNRSQAGVPHAEEWPQPHSPPPDESKAPHPLSALGTKSSLQELRECPTLGEGIASFDKPSGLFAVLDQQGRAPALPHLEARSPRHRSRDNRKRGCPSQGGDASEPPFSSAAPLGAGQAITDELPGFSQGEQGGPGRQRMLSFLPASRRLTRT